MVADQLAERGIRDPRVLAAFRRVPREHFVDPDLEAQAYGDQPLPIGCGQTISQPYVVALMTELLALGPGDRVLEIGTGSGYATAILASIAAEVWSVERFARLAEAARARLAELGIERVHIRVGDGTLGWPEHGPYDAIVVYAGGPRVPPALRAQLAPGGRMVIPVGLEDEQALMRLMRVSEQEFRSEDFGAVRFVPLVGREGWPDTPAG